MAKQAVFAPDAIAIANDGYVTFLDGKEIVLQQGSRHRGSEKIVIERPELFVADGEPVVPPERPEIPEPEPPAPKPKVAMLRVKRHFESGDRESKGPWGIEKFHFTLHAGQEIRADWKPLAALTRAEFKAHLEVIDP